jgi:predicted RNA-binding Zn-ribbon protein involved in translation (DUF1610 family)
MTLLMDNAAKLRCRKCHLVISTDELGAGYCPECHAVWGEKRYDFEKLVAERDEVTKYRCDECGAIIEWRGED